MKVLMINTVPTERNGITSVIMNIIRNIDHDSIVIDLLTINNPSAEYFEHVKRYGGKLITINNRLSHPLSYLNRLKKVIEDEKYDIIHAHGNSRTLAIEMFAAKIAGCRIRIAHSHSTSCKYKLLHYFLTPLFFLTCSARLSCGEKAGKWLYGTRSFTVINNGIDLERFKYDSVCRNKIRASLKLDNADILIGNVGDFNSDNKNQSFIIDMTKSLHKTDPRYHLILIGEGIRRKELQNGVIESGDSEYIHFAGTVNNVHEYLCALDYFVLPSKFEGLPLTVIEAQASGLNSIVSESVTREVDLTHNVSFASINDGIKHWEEAVLASVIPQNRILFSQKACKDISDNGFDIKEECRKLKKIYINLYKRTNI